MFYCSVDYLSKHISLYIYDKTLIKLLVTSSLTFILQTDKLKISDNR